MNKRLIVYDYLRIIGCILVVMVHVAAIHFYEYPVTGSRFLFAQIYDCIAVCGVPLFFMISGALLLDSKKELQIKPFLLHSVLRLVFILFFSTLFYNVLNYILVTPSLSFTLIKEKIIIPTFSGQGVGIGHLWYLPTIILLYLVTPLLKKTFMEKKICEYFLVLYFIVSILWNTLMQFDLPFSSMYTALFNIFPFSLINGYVGYYVLGHYIANFCPKFNLKGKLTLLFSAVAGMIFTIFFCMWDSIRLNSASSITNNPFTLGMFVTVGCTFALFISIFGGITVDKNRISHHIVTMVSGLTLSIYIFHPFILRIIHEFSLPTDFLHPVISIPILIILVFLSSSIIALFIKFIQHIIRTIKKKRS